MKKVAFPALLLILSAGLLATAQASQPLLMARSPQTFPESMLKLQETLGKHSYVISRVQRIDVGLTNMGYTTDKYRVVFYGRHAEVLDAIKKYPQLAPYLPLKIAMFAEGEETLLVSSNPLLLTEKDNPQLNKILKRWEKDLESVFAVMREE